MHVKITRHGVSNTLTVSQWCFAKHGSSEVANSQCRKNETTISQNWSICSGRLAKDGLNIRFKVWDGRNGMSKRFPTFGVVIGGNSYTEQIWYGPWCGLAMSLPQ